MARFAQIALGSLYELDTLLQIADHLKFSNAETVTELRERLSILSRQISSFIQKLRVSAQVLPPTSHRPPPATL
jgi:four helix bundle protein